MKKRVLSVLIFLIAFSFITSAVYSASNSAPNNECYVCHQNPEGSAELKVEGIPKQYKPGETYKIKLELKSKIKSETDVEGGFSATASAGEFIVIDKKNTQISDAYITHTPDGSKHKEWKFAWKAPKQKGEVELKIMAVAANGDFSPSGDAIAAEAFTIKSKK
ncbi:MAG: hypothetical protein LLF28_03200 [Nitrospiraceae bacterium]|nr:hypothetical protein [Nitrospiraceae bacterium]